MEQLHSLLKRQLRQHFGDQFSIPKDWQGFIDSVNDAYWETDTARGTLERSLELRSQELLQANTEMRAIFLAIPDLLFRLDAHGRILNYKAGATTDLLLHPKELLGKRIQDIPLQQVSEKFHEAIQQVQKLKTIINFEYSLSIQDQPLFFEARLVPLPEDQIVVIIRNITDRKQSEETLKRERNLFRVLIDNLPDAIYVKDAECRKTIANVADVRNMGRKSEAEVIGKTDFDFYPADIAEGFHADDLSVVQSGIPVLNKEEFFFDKDGRKSWLLTFKFPMRDDQGRIIGLVGIGREITRQKRAMEELTLLSHTVKSTGESISITDLNNKILFVNEAFLKTYGYTEQEIIGKPISIVTYDPMINDQEVLRETIKGGWQGELLNRKKDGTIFSIFLSTSIVNDERGQPIGLVGVATDITKHKHAEEALQESNDKLRNIVENSTNLFYSRNTDQVFTYLSPQVKNILDCEPEEALVNFTNFMTNNSINKLGCDLANKAVQTGARQEAYELELMSRK